MVWSGRASSLCPVIQHAVITQLRFYLYGLSINDTLSYVFVLRSSLQMSAPRQRAVTGIWSTFAVLSARRCLGVSVTSWRRDGPTAVPASSPCMQSTAIPAGNILVCCLTPHHPSLPSIVSITVHMDCMTRSSCKELVAERLLKFQIHNLYIRGFRCKFAQRRKELQ